MPAAPSPSPSSAGAGLPSVLGAGGPAGDPADLSVGGEGGSGGALGLSVANRVYMLENAVFSVISPEGCASILWEDASKAADAAECLKITAEDMKRFGVAEDVIEENFDSFDVMCEDLKARLLSDVQELEQYSGRVLSEKRYERFRKLGVYSEK